MSLFRVSLLIGLVVVVTVLAASGRGGVRIRGRGRGRIRAIDEILAIAGDMRHGRANPRGLNRAFGMKRLGGKAEIVEYDILRAIPEETSLKRGVGRSNLRQKSDRSKPKRKSTRHFSRGRSNRSKRNAINYESGLWLNGYVPYVFENGLKQSTKDAFADAISEYSKYTCIQWSPRKSEKDYVMVKGSGGGCYATIGKAGGQQTLNINENSCIYQSVIIHEMLHALGVFHEHTRPDRDSYVTINTGNISPGSSRNFDKRSNTKVYNIPYDYRSVMHYGKSTFSSNGGNTVVPKDSTYLDIIGKAPTLSFRDIQLINVMYDCPGNARCENVSCPANGFLGHDCKCKCPITNDDYSNPVLTCAEVCPSIDTACNCPFWTDACAALPNSYCDSTSKACKCDKDKGYTEHNGVCTLISDIKCTALNTDCKCTLNVGACEKELPPATCDGDTNACICSGQYIESNGKCVNLDSVSCDSADKTCGCSSKGSKACSEVSNSFCDSETDACTCNTGYYNKNGVCTQAPSCSTMDSACHCEVQGPSACSAIVNTECNTDTGACECPSLYINSGGQCHLQYVTDGETVSPFENSNAGNVDFTSMTSTPEGDNSAYGIAKNDFYLLAEGNSGDKAVLETGFITRKAGEKICFKGGLHLKGSQLTVRQEVGNPMRSWSSRSLYYPGDLGYFYGWTVQFGALSSANEVKFILTAQRYGSSHSSDWFMKLDPVYIGDC